jgi:hypothetical protein
MSSTEVKYFTQHYRLRNPVNLHSLGTWVGDTETMGAEVMTRVTAGVVTVAWKQPVDASLLASCQRNAARWAVATLMGEN